MKQEWNDKLLKISDGCTITVFEGDIERAYQYESHNRGGGFLNISDQFITHYIGYAEYDLDLSRIIFPFEEGQNTIKYPMRGYIKYDDILNIVDDEHCGGYAIKTKYKYLNVYSEFSPYFQFSIEDPESHIILGTFQHPYRIK